MPHDVTDSEFARLVEAAIAELPERWRRAIEEDVPVEVRDRPTRQQLESVDLEEDHLLLGLYHGVPLTLRSVEDNGRMPDVIYLFKQDIEDAASGQADLVEQVRVTLLHELGHHFGLDEDDLDRLGYQ